MTKAWHRIPQALFSLVGHLALLLVATGATAGLKDEFSISEPLATLGSQTLEPQKFQASPILSSCDSKNQKLLEKIFCMNLTVDQGHTEFH